MDVPRGEGVVKARQRRRIIMGVGALLLIVVVTVALSKMEPRAPLVEAPWFDDVKRGEMLIQHRGLGTLVPEDIRWIPATTQGRVENIVLRPGVKVTPGMVIVELSNPTLEQEAKDAELQLKVVQADLENLRVQLESQFLTMRSDAARMSADYTQAKLQAEADQELYKSELISKNVMLLSTNRAQQLATQQKLENERLEKFADSMKAQLAARKAQVEQRSHFYDLKRQQLDELNVRAGMAGVVQEVPLEVGQQVQPGTNLVRVSNPTRLKAEVRIAETQARDIAIGQKAQIDTRNGIIPGRVVRKDPAAVNGTVLVDVALEGPLPPGAVPQLSVDGTIEIVRLPDVVYVGRPVQGQPNTTVGLFKMEEDGIHARRVQVKLGRTSVNTVEVLEGLKVGDRVILSDMSQVDNFDRVRVK